MNRAENEFDLIYRFSTDYLITYVNKAFAEFFKQPPESFLGKPLIDIFPAEDRKKIRTQFELDKKGNQNIRHERRLISPKGLEHWFLCRDVPVFNNGKPVKEYESLGIEITERKKMEDSLRLTQFSVDKALDGVFWVGGRGEILYVNDSGCRTTGYSREELLGMKIFEVDPDFKEELFEDHIAEMRRIGSMRFESRHQRKDGSIFPVEVTTSYFDYKGYFIGCAFDRDISERKKAEKELEKHREHLEELVEERTAELEKVMKQLVQAEKLAALGHLVAGVAHELNTPLGNARLMANTLGEEIKGFAALAEGGEIRRADLSSFLSRSIEASRLLESNAVRAADLISQFKQVAVDQTSMRIREFNLKQVIEEILASLNPQIKHTTHRIELDIPGNITLYSYPGPLQQVLTNFVSNSLLHGFSGREGGAIRISAGNINQDRIFLEYSDNGTGVHESELNRIFEPFYTTKLGKGGSGLGLYIVFNTITGLLKGSIKITEHERGLTFSMQLPLKVMEKSGDS